MAIPQLDVFQVIADPSRRKMLMLLTEDTLSINGLAAHFEMSRPAVSKHISILEKSGFIRIHNVGRERYCQLNEKGFDELREWIDHFDTFWQEKLQSLQKLIANKDNL